MIGKTIRDTLKQICHQYDLDILRVDEESRDVVEDVCALYIKHKSLGVQEISLLIHITDRITADEDHANDTDALGTKHRSMYARGF